MIRAKLIRIQKLDSGREEVGVGNENARECRSLKFTPEDGKGNIKSINSNEKIGLVGNKDDVLSLSLRGTKSNHHLILSKITWATTRRR